VNESAFHPKDKAVSKVRKAIPEAMRGRRSMRRCGSRVSMNLVDAISCRMASPTNSWLNRTRASSSTNDLMKDEYDFLTAKRGKFFREGTRLVPPIHLDPEVLDYLSERALARGVSLSSLVNVLLKQYRTDRRPPE
jgi:hypothetical protein